MSAAIPENETERLQALYDTGLLDSHPEEEFDSLVRLAAVVCETPIALMTLLDRERQWFKANVGLAATETERSVAFCAHTILQPDTLIVADALQDARFAHNPLVVGEPGIRFYAGLPLETRDGLRLGSLCVIDRSPRKLSARQLEALQLLAMQASKQINLRLQQNEMALAMTQSNLIEQELRKNQGLFHAFMDNAPFLAFMKDAQGRMVYYNRHSADHFSVGRDAWLNRKDDELWPPEVAAAIRENDRSVLCHWKTIIVEEHVRAADGSRGDWRSYKFPFRDSEGREYVASFAVDITADKESARKIANYQKALEAANEQLLALSVTDGLTRLLNRRAFETALESEFATSRRYGTCLSLLILDIDNFKLFNDDFGHEMGDRVLVSVAATIKGAFRSTDTVARYGGEEFSILLPNTTRQSAVESAERLRNAIRGLNVEGRPVTVSIGASSTAATGSLSKADLVRRADEALYRAKREGKDRICIA
jgi:diguanylate cyclase (GGDEF)-like protein/PAS domain S-box-containing protein